MEDKLQNSPCKSQIEVIGKNIRRNPYKVPVQTSPTKIVSKPGIDKSPRKKLIVETSPIKAQTIHNSPRKKLNKPTDSSPLKKQNKFPDSPQRKLNDSPQKKLSKFSDTSPKGKRNETKATGQLQNEPFPRSIPRIKLEEQDEEPQKTTNDQDRESTKPKKKHHLIQEYNPDIHGAEFERTLAIIKPNAMTKTKSILSIIKRNDLLLLKTKKTYLKPDQVRDFYLQSLDEENNKYYRIFRELVESEGGTEKLPPDLRTEGGIRTVETSTNMEEYVEFMTSGPVEILIIAGRGAVKRWLYLMGPEDPRMARTVNPDTIRARYGGESVLRNGVYGSLSSEQAEKEIKYFFPDVRPDKENAGASGEYLSKTVNPILLKGLIQLCRQKPDNPLVWLADWLLANNPHTKSS